MLGQCRHFPTVAKIFESSFIHRRLSKTAIVSSRESKPGSLFSDQPSEWGLLDTNPPPTARHSLRSTTTTRSSRHRPRQSMTARESSVFDEMFEMIFEAVSAQEKGVPSTSTSESAIGVGRGNVDDLIGKLRRYPRKLKPSSQVDEAFDRQKEAMDLCNTDQELLQWAFREVFGESQRYEEEARKAISQAAISGVLGELPTLQPPTYPHLVAHLMRTFRDKYNDPHLALAMFDHARHLSIASYVFGCSTQAYNELIGTRWKFFYDLKGVHEALEEMKVNGVKFDVRTRKIVELVRREVGERNLSFEDSGLLSGETWDLLREIEELLTSRAPRKVFATETRMSNQWDNWKTTSMKDTEGDAWGFNQWDIDRQSSQRRRMASRGLSTLKK